VTVTGCIRAWTGIRTPLDWYTILTYNPVRQPFVVLFSLVSSTTVYRTGYPNLAARPTHCICRWFLYVSNHIVPLQFPASTSRCSSTHTGYWCSAHHSSSRSLDGYPTVVLSYSIILQSIIGLSSLENPKIFPVILAGRAAPLPLWQFRGFFYASTSSSKNSSILYSFHNPTGISLWSIYSI